MPRHTANGDPSPADRLSSRWQMFRRETNTLYDTLLWQPQEWPILTLQWQPTAWQPPQHVLDLLHAAAEQAAAAALGLDNNLYHDSSHSAAAAGTEDMDIDSAPAAAAAAGRGFPGSGSGSGSPVRSHHSADDDVIAMPFEYQYILTGQQTDTGVTSNLVLWRVSLLGQIPSGFDPHRQQLALTGGSIEPVMMIPHGQQDVNRLHLMPQNTNLVATCSDDPQVRIYDLSRNTPAQYPAQRSGSRSPRSQSAADHDLDRDLDHDPDPDLPPELTAVLGGRSAGGFGLEWNPVHEGLLLGADVQGSVQIWDVGSSSSSSTEGAVIKPVKVDSEFSSCAINDISWHRSGNIFAAATEDGQLLLQDIRAGAAAAVLGVGFDSKRRSGRAHVRKHRAGSDSAGDLDCLCVDFDPNHTDRLATGGKDGYVNIWDMRRLACPLERLPLHAGDVQHVSWSRGAPGLLASAGKDSHVLLWDVHKMKNAVKRQQQRQQAGPSAAAAADPPGLGLSDPRVVNRELSNAIQHLSVPGLLFLHHGHMSAVEQVAWNPDRPWMLASVSALARAAGRTGEDVEVQHNTLMVWEVNRSVGLLC